MSLPIRWETNINIRYISWCCQASNLGLLRIFDILSPMSSDWIQTEIRLSSARGPLNSGWTPPTPIGFRLNSDWNLWTLCQVCLLLLHSSSFAQAINPTLHLWVHIAMPHLNVTYNTQTMRLDLKLTLLCTDNKVDQHRSQKCRPTPGKCSVPSMKLINAVPTLGDWESWHFLTIPCLSFWLCCPALSPSMSFSLVLSDYP